mgnify:CR=1 FL=1
MKTSPRRSISEADVFLRRHPKARIKCLGAGGAAAGREGRHLSPEEQRADVGGAEDRGRAVSQAVDEAIGVGLVATLIGVGGVRVDTPTNRSRRNFSVSKAACCVAHASAHPRLRFWAQLSLFDRWKSRDPALLYI